MPYMVTWIPSIYPLYVSINIPAPAGSVMGIILLSTLIPILGGEIPLKSNFTTSSVT